MLAPLGALYGRAALARRRRAEARPSSRRRLARPVISIGNLAVGGSGKTPFTRWLASWLLSRGDRPSILSRGYGRAETPDEVVVVSDGHGVLADLRRAGDEPLMIARGAPGTAVLVCADRFRAGEVAERRLACTVHLLDDGFQHLKLHRDVDLLLIDEQDMEDRVLPAGRLREPIDAARSADAVLWTGREDAGRLASRLGVAAGFRLRRVAGPPTVAGDRAATPGPGSPVVALAGIARPERFFRELEAEGYDVRARLAFRDHHPYSKADVERIRRAAAGCGAVVLTTEKDLVRLLPLGPLPFGLAWRRLEVLPEDAAAFCAWLGARLDEVRLARAAEEPTA